MNSTNEFDEKAGNWDDNLEHARRSKAIADAIGEEILIHPLQQWNTGAAPAC